MVFMVNPYLCMSIANTDALKPQNVCVLLTFRFQLSRILLIIEKYFPNLLHEQLFFFT